MPTANNRRSKTFEIIVDSRFIEEPLCRPYIEIEAQKLIEANKKYPEFTLHPEDIRLLSWRSHIQYRQRYIVQKISTSKTSFHAFINGALDTPVRIDPND